MSNNKELTSLLDKICYSYGVSVMDVRSMSRKERLVDVRRVFSIIAKSRGYGPTEVGRFLNIDHSSVIHYLEHQHLLDPRGKRIVASMTDYDTMISGLALKLVDNPEDPQLQRQMLKLLVDYDIKHNQTNNNSR